MFRPIRIASFVVASSVLSACAIPVALQPNQIGDLSKNTSATELETKLGKATPNKQVEFSENNTNYLARQYLLQVGSRTEMRIMCTPNCFAYPDTVAVHNPYLVIQTLPTKELFAWGTLEELSKSPDSAISSIMPLLKQKLQEKTNTK